MVCRLCILLTGQLLPGNETTGGNLGTFIFARDVDECTIFLFKDKEMN